MAKEIKTLQDFYESLENRPTPPKTAFVKKIAKRTGKELATVRLWVKGETKPQDQSDWEILSEETGIAIENLFEQ